MLDIGQAEDGAPFIVQELLDGEDLGAFVHAHGGRLTIRDALSIMIPAIDAVAFAHARGVIHRDLKPENIFIARDPTGATIPKLLDFGISRIVSAEEQRMSATGMSVGTPAYMSPEQIRADAVVDARTDVWSIGVILHELLAGALPFQSSSHTGLFVKIVTELPIPLADALPGAPPALSAIVEKCLQARPDARYASAADVARDLRVVAGRARCRSRRGSSCPPLASPRRPRVPAPTQAGPSRGGPRRRPRSRAPGAQAPARRQRAGASARGPASSGARVVLDHDMSAEIVPLSDMRLDLAADPAMLRPMAARVARATHGMRTDVDRNATTAERSIVGLGVMWALVLVLTWVLTTVAPGGWPVVAWATALDGAPFWAGYGAAGLALALGIAAFVIGARAEPISWGFIVAAPGLLLDSVLLAGFVVRGLPSLTGSGGLDALARMAFPWPTILVLVGLCIVALRHGWAAWTSHRSGRTSGAAIGVVLAALALFGAVEIFRGAESAPQGSNIAS